MSVNRCMIFFIEIFVREEVGRYGNSGWSVVRATLVDVRSVTNGNSKRQIMGKIPRTRAEALAVRSCSFTIFSLYLQLCLIKPFTHDRYATFYNYKQFVSMFFIVMKKSVYFYG